VASNSFQGVVDSVIGANEFSRALVLGLSEAMQVEQLRAAGQAQTEALIANTAALLKSTASRATGGVGASAGGFAQNLLSGFGPGGLVGPLVSGLIGLLGGGKAEAPAPLVVYTPPAAVKYEGAFSRSEGSGVQSSAAPSWTPQMGGPQITVQVQAMDSRSFLDHREEIAQAVREAMLNSHALNAVVKDL
jgi:uncharacterized membrane protein